MKYREIQIIAAVMFLSVFAGACGHAADHARNRRHKLFAEHWSKGRQSHCSKSYRKATYSSCTQSGKGALEEIFACGEMNGSPLDCLGATLQSGFSLMGLLHSSSSCEHTRKVCEEEYPILHIITFTEEEMQTFLAVLIKYRAHYDDYPGSQMCLTDKGRFTELVNLVTEAWSVYEKSPKTVQSAITSYSVRRDEMRIEKSGLVSYRVTAGSYFGLLAFTAIAYEIYMAPDSKPVLLSIIDKFSAPIWLH